MKGQWLLFLTILSYSQSEWILLPSVTSKTEVKKQLSTLKHLEEKNFQSLKNVTSSYETSCPDFHNLTMMSFGSFKEETDRPPTEWEVSYKDVEELIREAHNIPQSPDIKSDFVRRTSEKLMTEAEKRIRSLILPKSRETRTTHMHYPSMEGALMTISMLLFGVYLTKLILKLLQSHYAKYNPNIGMLGGIRQPIMIAHHRETRENAIETELRKLHVMHLIDKYNSQVK